MSRAVADSAEPSLPRRHRSRQRERMVDWLRVSDRHPTAAEIHDALQREMPMLSLGTVYRNLEILVADGLVDEVPCSTGAARYDGNVDPHQHFDCVACGRLFDIPLPTPRGLAAKLERDHGLRAHRIRISFSGLCRICDQTRP